MSGIFDNNFILSKEWSEKGINYQYLAQLSPSIRSIPLDYFSNKNFLFGQFAAFEKIDTSTFEAIRDPLGIGKIFYTETEDGEIHFSEKFTSLFKYKTPIFSVPSGMHVRIGSSGLREVIREIEPEKTVNPKLNANAFKKGKKSREVALFRSRFAKRLEQVFSLIRCLEDEGWFVFIALSGGLDSSIIAKKATEYLSKPTACTLDLGNSEDAIKSVAISKELDINHLVFKTIKSEILDMLEKAPLLCQDFRDFNVHCTALNLLLAKNIRDWVDSNPDIDENKIIVLTGDLMNEYTCDYAGEVIDGIEYYRLPAIGKKELQRYLINGLDTSDREISPFGFYGLKCIQPYAVLHDLYSSLDGSLLESEDPKKLVNSFLVGEKIKDLIPKAKLRAQVGSRETMGILGICHELKINNSYFINNLLNAFDAPKDSIPIFLGKYEVESFS